MLHQTCKHQLVLFCVIYLEYCFSHHEDQPIAFYSFSIYHNVLLLFRFLPQLRETRKEFVRIGDDLETAAMKNAQISRHKASDAERSSHLLLATRKCYQHFALDYCLQVDNILNHRFINVLIISSFVVVKEEALRYTEKQSASKSMHSFTIYY